VPVSVPRTLTVAYVTGVSDAIAPALRGIEIPTTVLTVEELPLVDLARYTTVVIGPRAYDANPELVTQNPRLLDWVRNGGTLVVQYGQFEMSRPGMMPYPITHTRPAARVTIEEAPVQVLDATSRLLTWPNRIGADDWREWVQERALYMPSTFDARYPRAARTARPGRTGESRGDPRDDAREGAVHLYHALAVPAGAGGRPGVDAGAGEPSFGGRRRPAAVSRMARTRVVIIGGGFGGLNAARALARADVEVLLIDRTNHHLFQPLLYQVATTSLAPSEITAPIRWVLRAQKNVTTLLGTVEQVDRRNRAVRVKGEPDPVHYDYLILATGTRHAYFGHDEWEKWAPGLKNVEDARRIRKRFLLAFERAEWEEDPGARQALLTFVVVGGGPTGVELAGVLPEMCRVAFRPDFRRIDTAKVRVILVEGGPRILPAFPESLSARAQRDLEKLGVEVRTNTLVTHIDEQGVDVGSERIASQSVFWAAGNAASPLGKTLDVPLDRVGRVLVEPDLSVPGDPRVFVIGDLAAAKLPDGSFRAERGAGGEPDGTACGAEHPRAHRRRGVAAVHGTSTRATSRRSAATRRSRRSGAGGSASPATSPGSPGSSCTSRTSSASATASACCCSGRTTTSSSSAACG
jgi:NADH dehydrogenase